MLDTIIVTSVKEYNDCAGKKIVEVSSQASDELIPTCFFMTHRYLPPHDKLLLSTVAPGDRVVINPDELRGNLFMSGSFVSIVDTHHDREPICRCGHHLTSDGFGVYCPDPDCPLSLMARLHRLADTPFMKFAPPLEHPENYFQDSSYVNGVQYVAPLLHDIPRFDKPFRMVIDPAMWGKPHFKIDDVLLVRDYGHVSMASFLVEDLFRDFLDSVVPATTTHDPRWGLLGEFYGLVSEAIHRRVVDDYRQDHVIKCFIWALGIQALSGDVINQMCFYEKSLGLGDEVLLVYAYLLSHPQQMIQDLGIHSLEATAIKNEFDRRRPEMMDIFRPHLSAENMRDIFGRYGR